MRDKIKSFFASFKTYQWIVAIVFTLGLIAISIYYFNSFKTSKVYNVDFSALKQEENSDTLTLGLAGISLPKGDYSLAIGYDADSECDFYYMMDNDNAVSEKLLPTNGQILSKSYAFSLKMGTDRGRLSFSSPIATPVRLAFITIAGDKPIYTDGIIWGILSLLAIPLVWFAVYFFENSSHKISLLMVMALVLAQVLPFILTRGLIQGVDTRAHMMRIEGIYYGILDGQFPVIVQPEWNNSYGQIGALYPNVFLYVPALFRCLGMSQLGACKLFLFLLVVSGGIIAFASARSIFKRDWQVTLCCFVIMVDNMRVHDLMAGGRMGGSLLAEIFWPLLIAGIIELFYRNRNKWYLLAFGLAGCFCCHIISASVACILIAIISILSINRFKELSVRKGLGRAILLFIGLTLGTISCFLQFYFTDWGQGQLQWSDFFASLWKITRPFDDHRWISVIVCMLVCTILFITIAVQLGKKALKELHTDSFVIPLYVSASILLLMSTVYFPWALLVKLPGVIYYTNMLQNGYRFLSLAGCAYAFCLPELLEVCVVRLPGRRSYQSKSVIATLTVMVIMAAFNLGTEEIGYLRADDKVMLYRDEVIGEVEYTYDDYLPAGTKTEWYSSDAGVVSDERQVQSLAYEREGTYVYYSYTSSADKAYVEFPKFYYNGYIAYDEMAEEVPVYIGDHNRVRVYLEKSDTAKIIRLWYHVPWYLTLACSLSMGLWVASLMLLNSRVLKRVE